MYPNGGTPQQQHYDPYAQAASRPPSSLSHQQSPYGQPGPGGGASAYSYPPTSGAMDPAALMRQAQGQQGALPGTPQHNNPLHQQQQYQQNLGAAPRTPQQAQQYGNMAYQQQQQQQQHGGGPSYPPQQQTPGAMDPQRFNLANVNLSGLTPEKFQALPPQQQQMLRMALQQKQQQALGMGYPSSSMAGGAGGVPSPAMNGSPSPMGGAGSPAGGASGAYPYGGARPPSQGHPPSTPQGGQQGQQGQQPQQGAQAASFLKTLTDFYAKRGQPFPGVPSIEGRPVDLSTLYQLVIRSGGFQKCHQMQLWKQILSALGFPPDPATNQQPDSRAQALAQNYYTILLPFETMFVALRTAQQQQQQAALAAQRPGSAAGAAPSPINTAVAPSPLPTNSFTPQTPSQPLPQPPRQPSYGQPAIPTNMAGAAPFATAPSQQSPMPPPAVPLPGTQQPSQGGMMGAMGAVGEGLGQSGSATPGPIATPPIPIGGDEAKGKLNELAPGVKRGADDSAEATPPTNGATPSLTPAPDSNFNADASTSAAPAPVATPAPAEVKPESPAVPARRKRQKYAYVPLQRSVDTYAGWDLGMMEEMMATAAKRRPARQAMDLGLVDVHSLTMSVRSRLATEVAFALNSLTLISVAMKMAPNDPNGIPFPLPACGELLDELVDLLEETAFGVEDDWEEEVNVEEGKPLDEGVPAEDVPPNRNYRELFRLVTQEETELLDAPEGALKETAALADAGLPPLGSIETCLALTNLFRNLSISDENARFMASKRRLLSVLVKVANLPLRRDGEGTARWPIRVSASDLMALKKDVLETINHFGLDINLEDHSTATATGLFHLLLFFLADADNHEQLYFDLSSSPSIASRIPQPPNIRLSHYLELGLAAFARITLPDTNRYIVSQLSGSVDLFTLFESLIHHLPVSESDFQLVTSEPGLVFVENLAMSLYNLAFLAPVSLKLRLRVVPAFVRGLLRVVRRLAGTSQDYNENPFLTLSDRCISTLQVLSDLSGVAGKKEQTDTPWWGLPMGGEEEDRPATCQPTEADRGTVKQRYPPRASDGARSALPSLRERRGAFLSY
ncbi:hypothetical protein BCR35DRAFT_354100 [Leucosporidium creatinivorum]|uniref:ARID domain-containing protein n=1 Tax=Leucosporidium creatinivorum TaxID=106004 RepID=A0A1Y2EPD8_9BASI|nr:hypothetical protein BCR35DRAFT_354100 [Leucosporidium creatinivorum]